jgi:hypothetical protein
MNTWFYVLEERRCTFYPIARGEHYSNLVLWIAMCEFSFFLPWRVVGARKYESNGVTSGCQIRHVSTRTSAYNFAESVLKCKDTFGS